MRDIIESALKDQNLSLRSLADALNERLDGRAITHSAINHWMTGRSEPDTDFLVTVLMKYRDWRFDLALDLLQAKRPDVWGPDGIWSVRRVG